MLAPFRGLRYVKAAVGDLGTVVSPPYDVLDAHLVRDLEAGNRRNIVRLILSRRFDAPYLAVRRRLRQWRERGFLRADPEPSLYVYAYTVDGHTVRGLIGLAALRDESERVILPHEDVMPAPVADRAALMRATAANLEPILLVHEGTARLRDLVSEVTASEPAESFSAVDGSQHQLWRITDDEQLAAVAEELAPSTVLIADGHHRYAAYLRLRDELGGSGWDFGLAMLVDQTDYAMQIGPIHRFVDALTLADVEDLAVERGDLVTRHPGKEAAMAAISDPAHPDDPDGSSGDTGMVSFVLSDGITWAVYRTRRAHVLDARVLHEVLLPAWHVSEAQLGYHHSLDQAVEATQQRAGLLVAMSPPSLEQVMQAARAGERMPRKSTSFGPKPRMGVVMRELRDAHPDPITPVSPHD